jgi:hypothetical protein
MVVRRITPAFVKRGGQDRLVRIYGQNFVSGVTISFGKDITVIDSHHVSDTQYLAILNVASKAKLGSRTVTLSIPGLPGEAKWGFQVK